MSNKCVYEGAAPVHDVEELAYAMCFTQQTDAGKFRSIVCVCGCFMYIHVIIKWEREHPISSYNIFFYHGKLERYL